jgi:hypothetical protein
MSARISLGSLFIVVAFAAITTAVLLRPTFIVASAVWSLTLLILGAAIVGTFCSVGRARAFWAGFAFFGCAHTVLTQAPWFIDVTGRFIVTRQILDALGQILQYGVVDLSVNYSIWSNLYAGIGDPPTASYGYLS